MAAFSSDSARTRVFGPDRLGNPMCRHTTGSEPGGESRAEIVKLRQAIGARLGSFVKLGKSAKNGLGSCDALNPFSYRPPDIGLNPV